MHVKTVRRCSLNLSSNNTLRVEELCSLTFCHELALYQKVFLPSLSGFAHLKIKILVL